MKKLSKLDEKIKKKTENLINKKSLKLNKKIRKKINNFFFCKITL